MNASTACQCFHDQWFFDAAFVNRLHNRVQMFLRSCAQGETQQLNIMALDWSEWLTRIAMNEFSAFPPYWLNLEDIPDNNKRIYNSSTGGGSQPTSKRQRQTNDDTVYLQDWEPGSRLQPNESYQKVFHVRNKLGTNPPLSSSGIPLCHKFHATGQCKRSCRRSHSPLNEDEKRTWRAFIDHCREKYHQFLTSVGKCQRLQNQQHTTQTTTTAQTKPSPTIKHSPKSTATQKSNHGEKSI